MLNIKSLMFKFHKNKKKIHVEKEVFFRSSEKNVMGTAFSTSKHTFSYVLCTIDNSCYGLSKYLNGSLIHQQIRQTTTNSRMNQLRRNFPAPK